MISARSGWVRLREKKTVIVSETIYCLHSRNRQRIATHQGTAPIVPKYNFDFSNAICIHDDLIAGFQYASEARRRDKISPSRKTAPKR